MATKYTLSIVIRIILQFHQLKFPGVSGNPGGPGGPGNLSGDPGNVCRKGLKFPEIPGNLNL